MAKEDDLSENAEIVSNNSSDLNNSIVNKVKSFIPTTLSKWFRKSPSVSRRRDSDSDDESFILEQPPTKRAKLPDPELKDITTSVRSSNTLNGSLTKYLTKSQSKTSDLLNNIRPRQSFRNSYYTKPDVSSQINFLRDKSSNDVVDDGAVPGPSGIQKHQLVNNSTDRIFLTPKTTPEKVNGEKKTDSGGSTSGCSSMAHKNTQMLPDKIPPVTAPREDVNIDKCSVNSKKTQTSSKLIEKNVSNNLTLGNQSTRSLFAEHSFSPRLNSSSLSSRRPSFSSSSFGSSSLIDNTLTTERVSNSPFYAGRTMFGGAAAYRKHKEPVPNSTIRQNSIQIKPTNEIAMKNDNSASMSQTARRILDALEHFNTPIGDARKIPRLNISSKKLHKKGEERKLRTPYSRETTKPRIPTKELAIPTVPDILQIKRRDKFTERKKQTITKDNNPSQSWWNPDPPPVSLPNISLPITTLPKFELMATPSTPITTRVNTSDDGKNKFSKPIPPKTRLIKNPDPHTFQFAPPIKIDTCAKTLMSINNFKFSKPINLNDTTENSLNFKYPTNDNHVLKRKPINDNFLKDTSKSIQTTGSVMDVLSGNNKSLDNFKPSADTWECDSCMIRNKIDSTKCIACGTKQKPMMVSSTSSPANNSLINQFKMTTDKWECSTCLVRNNNADERCVACTALKPGIVTKFADNKPTQQSSFGFGNKFKAPASTWECTTCMIRNNSDVTKCAACETQKPGGSTASNSVPSSNSFTNTFGKEFTKKTNEWECPSCMVRNAEGKLTCACCEAPKPGSSGVQLKSSVVLPTSTPFKFGIDKADVKTSSMVTPSTQSSQHTGIFGLHPVDNTKSSVPQGGGFVFGKTENKIVEKSTSDQTNKPSEPSSGFNNIGTKKSDEWECPSCMVRNSNDKVSCVCCETPKSGGLPSNKGGITLPTSTPFKFGIDKVDSTTVKTTSAASGFTFGIKSPQSTTSSIPQTTQAGFSFGVNKTDTNNSEIKSPSTPVSSSGKNIPVMKSPPSNEFGSYKANSSVTYSSATTSTINFGKCSTVTFGSTNTSVSTESSIPSIFVTPSGSSTVTPAFGTSNTTVTTTAAASTTFTNSNSVPPTFDKTTSAFQTASANNNPFGNSNPSLGFSKPSTFGGNITTSNLTFGNNTVTTTASSTFGNNTTTLTPTFGTNITTTAASAFNNNTPNKTLAFGNSATTTTPFGNNTVTTPPTFGNNTATTVPSFGSTAATTIPAFGNNLPSSTFTFGEKVAENKPTFSFGSTESSATAPKVPAFSFNPSNTNFEFGAKQTPGFNSNNDSSKTNVPTFGSSSSNNNTFGVASQPVQNIPTNPSFGAAAPVFGSSTNSSSSAFQFGATANQPQAPVFSFGNSNQTQSQFGKIATPGSFGGFGNNQQTPAPSPAIPTFNPNTKPVFNFTSGPAPAFTAQSPSGTAALQPGTNPQRRIKKAVRRRGGMP